MESILLKKTEEAEVETPVSAESLLYPKLPRDYFEDKENGIESSKITIKSIIEKYDNAKIKPYLDIFDLNNDKESMSDNKPKSGVTVGLKMSF